MLEVSVNAIQFLNKLLVCVERLEHIQRQHLQQVDRILVELAPALFAANFDEELTGFVVPAPPEVVGQFFKLFQVGGQVRLDGDAFPVGLGNFLETDSGVIHV